MRDIRQSPNYAKYMESLGWVVESGIFIRKLPLLSFLSVIKVQRPTKINLSEIERIAKKYHTFMVKIEPDNDTEYKILNTKYKKDNWPLLPSKTIVLDLGSVSLETLPKDTRYEIRKSASNNLATEQSDNIDLFYQLLQETMKIGKWEIPIKKEVTALWKSFQPNNSAILFAYRHSGEEPKATTPESLTKRAILDAARMTPVAGCLLIWNDNTAHYMYAANTARGRELGAAYFTLWEAIKFCQKRKLKYLDLEGIYDERRPKDNKNWQGFTKFKMGWGGKVVEYPGSFSKFGIKF